MALLKSIQDFLGLRADDEGDEPHPDAKPTADSAPPTSPSAVPAAPKAPEDLLRSRALVRIFEGLLHKLELIDVRLEPMGRVEAAVGGVQGMVQFLAKAFEKQTKANDQAILELRAHLTTELDKLGASLRLDASKQASIDVFKAILPSLDDIDFMLKEAAGNEEQAKKLASLAMVQRKLKESFAKLGIEQIAIEDKKTHFDSELHDGEPWKGDATGLEKGTIVETARAGYKTEGLLIRAAKVLVQG